MAHEQDLIQAILKNPDDASCQLNFADWLQERGDPRAEFIHVQIALAQGSGDSVALRLREQEMLRQHQQEWLAPLASFGRDWQFERGFVSQGTITARTFRDHSEAIFRVAPLLRNVRFTGVSECAGLFDSPALGRLTAMDLSGQLLDDPEGCCLQGLRMDNLQSLNLSANPINTDSLFLSIGNLPTLVDLDLSYTGLSNLSDLLPSAEALLARIKQLNLSHNEIRDVYWFSACAPLGSLEALDLSHNWLGIKDAVCLFESEHVQNLIVLNLAYNLLGDTPGGPGQPMPRMLESRLFGQLAHLDLSGNPLGREWAWHFFYAVVIDEYGDTWDVNRGSLRVPIYSADGKSHINVAPGQIRQPQKLVLRDTEIDAYYRQRLVDAFGDRIVL